VEVELPAHAAGGAQRLAERSHQAGGVEGQAGLHGGALRREDTAGDGLIDVQDQRQREL